MHCTNFQKSCRENWMKKENLKEIDQNIRKIFTMYGGLHRRSNVDWLYITRGEGDEKSIRRVNLQGVSVWKLKKITEEANNQLLMLQ